MSPLITFLQISGVLFVIFVLFQLFSLVISSLFRTHFHRREWELNLRILSTRLDNLQERQEQETKNEKLRWTGFRKFRVVRRVPEDLDLSSYPRLIRRDKEGNQREYTITSPSIQIGSGRPQNIRAYEFIRLEKTTLGKNQVRLFYSQEQSGWCIEKVDPKKGLYIEPASEKEEEIEVEEVYKLKSGDVIQLLGEGEKIRFQFHLPEKEGLPDFEDRPKIISLYLEPYDQGLLPSFQPGQYLTCRFVIGDKTTMRCYSLSDKSQANQQKYYRISVKREYRLEKVGSIDEKLTGTLNKKEISPDLQGEFERLGVDLDKTPIEVRVLEKRKKWRIIHGEEESFLIKKEEKELNLYREKIGLVSNYIHDEVAEGDLLDIQAPKGEFYLDVNDPPPGVVLISGGIGITPLLSMLNTIDERKIPIESWFFYGVRNRREHIHKEHLEEVVKRHGGRIRLCVGYSGGDSQECQREKYIHQGRITRELLEDRLPHNNYHFYICGPEPMIHQLDKDLQSWGVAKNHIHYELFGPPSRKSKGKKKEKWEIVFRDGRSTKCGGDQYLLEVAEKLSPPIPIASSCRRGACHECKTPLLSGEVEYAVAPEKMPEEGMCLTCIATPKSDIELGTP